MIRSTRWFGLDLSETFTEAHLPENKAERETDTTAPLMIKAIICSHEADASGTAKCLLPGLGVKNQISHLVPH